MEFSDNNRELCSRESAMVLKVHFGNGSKRYASSQKLQIAVVWNGYIEAICCKQRHLVSNKHSCTVGSLEPRTNFHMLPRIGYAANSLTITITSSVGFADTMIVVRVDRAETGVGARPRAVA